MALGGFLGNIGYQAGQNIVYGQEQADKQANIDYKQAEVAQMKMSALAAQQKMQTQKDLGDYMKSQAAVDATAFTDPTKAAQGYSKMASMALANGDFASAEEMSKLAKGKLDEVKEAAAIQTKEQKQKKEDLSTAAYDYQANPTPEKASDLVKKAVAAGQDPSQIPPPGTAQYASWVNSQKVAALDSKTRAELVEKAQEFSQRQQDKKEEFVAREQDRAADRSMRAMMQQSMMESRRDSLDLRRQEIEDRKQARAEKAAAGPKPTATMMQANNAIVSSASEALRGSKLIEQLPNDQSAGPFQGLQDGTILNTLAKTAGNSVTPEGMQIYQTMTAGMGLELARVMTLGAGRGANQATIDEMQHIITVHPGDTNATALFKYANGVDIVRNRLETLPDTPDPKVAKQRAELEAYLAKVPTPSQVLATIKDPKLKKQALKEGQTMREAAEKARNQAESGGVDGTPGLPGSTDTGPSGKPPLPPAAGGGLPSGWSVKVHQ